MQEIGQVKMEEGNKGFPTNFKYATNIAMKVQVNDSWLWHKRFNHFNFHAMKLLYHKNMMRNLPSLRDSDEAYEECLWESNIDYRSLP